MYSVTFGIRPLWRISAPKAVLGLCLSVFLVSVPVFSQANMGRILGSITDSSGAVIGGARVTVTDVERGTSRVLTTDEAGAYNAPSLLPGTYLIRAELTGFKSIERPNVVLEVGREIKIDFSLEPGAISEKLTVTDEVSLGFAGRQTQRMSDGRSRISARPLTTHTAQRAEFGFTIRQTLHPGNRGGQIAIGPGGSRLPNEFISKRPGWHAPNVLCCRDRVVLHHLRVKLLKGATPGGSVGQLFGPFPGAFRVKLRPLPGYLADRLVPLLTRRQTQRQFSRRCRLFIGHLANHDPPNLVPHLPSGQTFCPGHGCFWIVRD